jgi:hypothetical protein
VGGFLLTLPFQQRFQGLDQFQTTLYISLVLLAALATALGLAPVSLHRTLFRRHEKAVTVAAGDRILRVMLAAIALLTAGVAAFVIDVVVNRVFGIIVGLLLLAILFVLLVLIPALLRSRARPTATQGPER